MSKELQVFIEDIQKKEKDFEKFLPKKSDVDINKFIKLAKMTLINHPYIFSRDRNSLMKALIDCATFGLYPDSKEAALVPVGREVLFMPMIGGILKRLRAAKNISNILCDTVTHKELKENCFTYDTIDGVEQLSHRRLMTEKRMQKENIAIVYAQIIYSDRPDKPVEIVDIEMLEQIKKGKDRAGSPWDKFFYRMAQKTAIKGLIRKVSLEGVDFHDLLQKDDDLLMLKKEYDALQKEKVCEDL